MKSFNYEVTGCHNCPYHTRDSVCAKSVFSTKKEYEYLSMLNYFILTPSCPEYSKAKDTGWGKYPETSPELEFVDANWKTSRQCLVSDGKDVMLAWLNSSGYGTLWQGAKEYRKDEITHWKYADLP